MSRWRSNINGIELYKNKNNRGVSFSRLFKKYRHESASLGIKLVILIIAEWIVLVAYAGLRRIDPLASKY